jgi:signal peptidase I
VLDAFLSFVRRTEGAVQDGGSAVKCELAADVLRAFGLVRFPASGWSMLPAVWPGDMLVVERVSSDQVRVGDVVVVGRDGRLCGHRVISVGGDSGEPQWITQGDALPVADRPVTENELLGRVAYLIRAGKRVAVSAELSLGATLIARILRRCFFAARGLVYLHRVYLHRVYLRRKVGTSEKSSPEEFVSPCQG